MDAFSALGARDACGAYDVEAYCTSVLRLVPLLAPLGLSLRLACRDLRASAARLRSSGFARLDRMVAAERANGTSGFAGSGTSALVLTHRVLAFVASLLFKVVSGGADLPSAASAAYSETLRQHHGWPMRAALHLALRTVPSTSAFFAAAAPSRNYTENARALSTLCANLRSTNAAIERLLAPLALTRGAAAAPRALAATI